MIRFGDTLRPTQSDTRAIFLFDIRRFQKQSLFFNTKKLTSHICSRLPYTHVFPNSSSGFGAKLDFMRVTFKGLFQTVGERIEVIAHLN